jgi:hypothetical protein
MLSPKRRGRHPWFGQMYYRAQSIVFVSSTGMSLLRREEDAYLFVLSMLAFGAASFGFAARRLRWRGWTSAHIVGRASRTSSC